jgi:hypothetical protein
MVGMCAVATTQRNWSVGGHLLAQLFVARSRVLSSLQLGAVLIVPWRCIGPASSCTVILLAENGLAPGVSMQVAVYPLHVAVLLRLLGVRGLSPILARSVVVLSISAVWSIGPAVCPVIFFSVTWVFCGPRLSVCLRHGTFRFGPTPRQHDRLQRGFVSFLRVREL